MFSGMGLCGTPLVRFHLMWQLRGGKQDPGNVLLYITLVLYTCPLLFGGPILTLLSPFPQAINGLAVLAGPVLCVMGLPFTKVLFIYGDGG